MRRHHAQRPGLDRRAIEPPEISFPLLHAEWVDRRHQMLVAVVEAFARPVLDRRRNAMRLEHLDLLERVPLDRRHIAAETARRHDGAAERCVDVEHRRERPVDPDGPRLFGHDPADLGRHLEVVDGGERQRVRHLGLAGETHPAALEVGGHQQRRRRRPVEPGDDLAFGGRIRPRHARHAARAKRLLRRDPVGIVAGRAEVEQLPDLVVRRQPAQRRAHPADRRPIEMKRLCRQLVVAHIASRFREV